MSRYEKELLRKVIRLNKVLEFFSQLEPCVVGIERCGGSHYWARELRKLGHKVRMPNDGTTVCCALS